MTTTTEYEIQGNYGQGWECLTTEDRVADARAQLRDYNANEPGIPHRIKPVRVAVEPDDQPFDMSGATPGVER